MEEGFVGGADVGVRRGGVLLLAPIQRSAWKGSSPRFAGTEFHQGREIRDLKKLQASVA